MRRDTITHRFLAPVLSFVAVWLAADWLVAWGMADPDAADLAVYKPVMNLLAGLRFGLLLFGALILYPALTARGATPGERILGSLAGPLAYLATAILRANAFFPPGEAVYYGFNSMLFGSLFLQFALMSGADIALRWQARRRGKHTPLVRLRHLAGILIGLSAIYLALFWDGGVHWFYVYQEGFKALFR